MDTVIKVDDLKKFLNEGNTITFPFDLYGLPLYKANIVSQSFERSTDWDEDLIKLKAHADWKED